MDSSSRPDRGPLYRSPAELRKMPPDERRAILEQMAIIAEPLYRNDPDLRCFEANEVLDYTDEDLLPRIYADFHNSDPQGRVRLNCNGTFRDLTEQHLVLVEGLILMLSDGEEGEIVGKVTYSEEEQIWAAVIDWDELQRR